MKNSTGTKFGDPQLALNMGVALRQMLPMKCFQVKTQMNVRVQSSLPLRLLRIVLSFQRYTPVAIPTISTTNELKILATITTTQPAESSRQRWARNCNSSISCNNRCSTPALQLKTSSLESMSHQGRYGLLRLGSTGVLQPLPLNSTIHSLARKDPGSIGPSIFGLNTCPCDCLGELGTLNLEVPALHCRDRVDDIGEYPDGETEPAERNANQQSS
ncbi:hypothetical protein AKJ16_DCAP03308 [Drosera capensis]